jgi:hypothetical protein
MGPTVVVDLPDAPAELQAKALEGCTLALEAGRCVARMAAAKADCYATIRWETPEQRRLLVTFRLPGSPEAASVERRLSFEEHDDLASRWSAAGLVVASLVGDHRRELEEARPPPSPPASVPTPATAVTIPANPTPQRSLSASMLGSLGFGAGARTRGGVELAIAGHLPRSPLLGALTASYALVPGIADLGSLRLSGGLGVRLGAWPARFGGELRGDFVWERLTATGTPAASPPASASQTRWGGRASAAVVVAANHRWSALTGAELTWLRPDVEVKVDDRKVGFEPTFRYGFFFGVRFSL